MAFPPHPSLRLTNPAFIEKIGKLGRPWSVQPLPRMQEKSGHVSEVYRFIWNEIDTVPHLEGLLLLWQTRPERWPVEEIASRLFLSPNAATEILRDLARRRWISGESKQAGLYWYEPDHGKTDELISAVEAAYRHDLIKISNLIHSKPPGALREFTDAFKFTKEHE